MADTVPLAVTVGGLFVSWFGVHYWRDKSTHWPSDPIKAVLTGHTIPASSRAAAPHTTIKVNETAAAPASTPGAGGPVPAGTGSAAGMVAIALSQVGTKETGTNDTPYGVWYGMQAEWCDIFVSWCAWKNGSLPAVGGKQSFVPTHKAWFVSQGTYHQGSAGIQAGDIVIQAGAIHVGIATGNGTDCISGNWNNSVSHSTFAIDGYGRPRYGP